MYENNVLNIPFLFTLLNKWKKKILIFLFALMTISAVVLFLTPNRYYAYSTAMSTNAQLNDKSSIYSNNLDELHSSLGGWNDLDRLYSTCELDTSYFYIIQKFNLIQHYKVKMDEAPKSKRKALTILKEENMKIEKTETGLLRIHVWDKDPQIASDIANAFLENIEKTNHLLQKQYNQNILSEVKQDIQTKSLRFKHLNDSLAGISNASDIQLLAIQKNTLLDEIQQLEKIANQFELMLKAQQPALIVIDKATPNKKHNSPNRLITLITILVGGLMFSIFLITSLEGILLYHNRNEKSSLQ